jgi:hypothetical protein
MESNPVGNSFDQAQGVFASGVCLASVEATSEGQVLERKKPSPIWPRVAVLFLLVALTGLSTFAKYTPYLPRTNPSHFVNHATKMKVAQSPVVLDRVPLYPVATVIPPRPAYRPRCTDRPVAPPIQLIGLTVSLQHRSPPSSLA